MHWSSLACHTALICWASLLRQLLLLMLHVWLLLLDQSLESSSLQLHARRHHHLRRGRQADRTS